MNSLPHFLWKQHEQSHKQLVEIKSHWQSLCIRGLVEKSGYLFIYCIVTLSYYYDLKIICKPTIPIKSETTAIFFRSKFRGNFTQRWIWSCVRSFAVCQRTDHCSLFQCHAAIQIGDEFYCRKSRLAFSILLGKVLDQQVANDVEKKSRLDINPLSWSIWTRIYEASVEGNIVTMSPQWEQHYFCQLLLCNGLLIEITIELSEAFVSDSCSRCLITEIICQEFSQHSLHLHCASAIMVPVRH